MNEGMRDQMKKILSDVEYPASKSEIVDMAKSENATQEEMDMLNKLPDRQYNDMMDVTGEMDKMGMKM